MVSALHTAGDLLNFHPHVHSIVLSGGIDHQETFHPFERKDAAELERVFANRIFAALLGEGLIDEETVESMKSWEHSGFNVFVGDEVSPGNTDHQLFLARYLKRNPVALERMEIRESGGEPTLRIIKSLDEPEIYQDFSPLDFLAELSQHIPDTFEQTTRYFGLYSARTRGVREKSEPEPVTLGVMLPEDEPRRPSSSWARLIKKVYEVDPLLCPRCGEQMKIIAFIQQESEIKKICNNLGLEDWRAPPGFAVCQEPQLVDIFDDLQYQ